MTILMTIDINNSTGFVQELAIFDVYPRAELVQGQASQEFKVYNMAPIYVHMVASPLVFNG